MSAKLTRQGQRNAMSLRPIARSYVNLFATPATKSWHDRWRHSMT